MKIAVKEVKVTRAEGPTHECITRTVASLDEATSMLRRWSFSAPKNGGYDKCDFWITFADGEVYAGRFDMTYDLEGEGSLQEHVQSHLMFIAGLHRPLHMDAEKYTRYIRQHVGDDNARSARAYMETYDLGPQIIRSNIDLLEVPCPAYRSN
jgi:hypothetical protein